jgi:transcriptional regulator with GAF, ATPase, and Fis domain
VQVKLLRVLQEGCLERVGGDQTLTVDVRVIAATNRDLPAAVAAGRFRADLFYRLNVYPITVPPLRKRKEDIPLLVRHFTAAFGKELGKSIDQVPPAVLDTLTSYHWPGNIRELRNVIERAVITSSGPTLYLAEKITGTADWKKSRDAEATLEPLSAVERRHIATVLAHTGWRISGPKGAAGILGLNPSTLRFRMKKHGITRNDRQQD